MSIYGINMVNPIRQGEIKYSSPLQDEEWPPLHASFAEQKRIIKAQQAKALYHERFITPLEQFFELKQKEIKYARSFLENEEWLLEKKMTEAQQAQVPYHQRLPLTSLEELFELQKKEIEQEIASSNAKMLKRHNEIFGNESNIPKQLLTELISITYDKDGNVEMTIQI